MNHLHAHCSEQERDYNRKYYESLQGDIEPEAPFSRVPKCVQPGIFCTHTTLLVCGITIKCIRPWPCPVHPESKGEKRGIRTLADNIIQGLRRPMAKKVCSQHEETIRRTGLTESEIREIYE